MRCKVSKILSYMSLFMMVGGVFFMFSLWSRAGQSQDGQPKKLLSEQLRFPACPTSPNCVSSFESSKDQEHYFGAVELKVNPIELIAAVMDSQKAFRVIFREAQYVQATHTSSLFRFVDDIAFYYDAAAQKLHVYSASRVGHSDLGANRKRVENILQRLSLFPE